MTDVCMKAEISTPFQDIRVKVSRMVDEVRAMPATSPSRESQLWCDVLQHLDYIRELSDGQLNFIRTHTSFITGTFCYAYTHLPVRNADDDTKERDLGLVFSYKVLTQDLPPAYHGSEPVPNSVTENVGVWWRGKFLTDDLMRYQRTVTNLYRAGLLPLETERRRVYLEIGGGYGGLAHQISNIKGNNSCYIIIDLPNMLFWSGVYLRLNNPEKKIYIYDVETYSELGIHKIVDTYDFVLLPNYLIHQVDNFSLVDVAINMLSFQEMSDDQIEGYCRFLKRYVTGWIYSDNFSRHVFNQQLTKSVFEILASHFDMIPDCNLGSIEAVSGGTDWSIYPYLGRPHGSRAVFAPHRTLLLGSMMQAEYSVDPASLRCTEIVIDTYHGTKVRIAEGQVHVLTP